MLKHSLSKRLAALALCGALALSLTACQEDPEGTIVAHKDMDKLISQAAGAGDGQADAAQVVQDTPPDYQTTLKSEELGVTVNVKASVEVPTVETLSIYRVRQKPFDQAFVDKVRQELMGDGALYDGAVLDVRTRDQVEEDIASWREAIASLDEDYRSGESAAGWTEEEIQGDIQVFRQEYQNEIDRLQEEYESAPTEIDFTSYPSDGQLRTVSEMCAQHPEMEFYEWLNSLSGEGDQILYAITEGADGSFRALQVQNNRDYSNKLSFRQGTSSGYPHMKGVVVGGTGLAQAEQMEKDSMAREGISDSDAFWQEKGLTGPVLTGGYYIEPDWEFEPVYEDATLSQEEAQAIAEEFLGKLGLEGFALDQGGLYTELLSLLREESKKMPYARYYVFQYRRQIDGVPLTQSSGEKYQDGWGDDGSFNKQMWPGELIEFRINDRGIVGFDYHAPLEITETVVEGAALKTFEQVKSTFEQMLPVTLSGTDEQHVADVTRVRLSYSRISEKDSFDTGLVVPVWSFEGMDAMYDDKGGSLGAGSAGVLMAINAIDGSVINGALGY